MKHTLPTREKDLFYKIIADPDTRLTNFRKLSIDRRGFLLLQMSKRIQASILQELTNEEIAEIFSFLDPDQAADLLQRIENFERRDKILKRLQRENEDKIRFLLRFHPDTAAGIMDINYIVMPKIATLEDVAVRMEEHEVRTGKIPTVLVVENGILLGEVPSAALVLHNRKTVVEKHIKPIHAVHYKQETDEVVRMFTDTPHSKVAVLDDNHEVLGLIYSDDVIRLLNKESTTALYDFAGVRDEEEVFDPIHTKVKHRYKWLIINLGTAYLAAAVVSIFQGTISKFVLLATYMPIVAGMGGNAATQTLAVLVRGLALGEIELRNCFRAIINEVGAGILNGAINGVIVAAVAFAWNHSPRLGFITAAAMIINLVVAGFFGAIIPLIMKRLGKDPATSATIFITTATDVFGFFTFLGLATIFLK